MPQAGNIHSPFRDGLAAVWHEPALLPAELVWRWCFGLSAWGLGIFSLVLFLDSLKLSRADVFLIRSWQPQLLDSALRHIFRGSLLRFLAEQSVLILGVTLLWAWAAAAGRAATLRRLVAMFAADVEEEPQPMAWHFGSIFALQLLRAMWSMIALAVTLGSLAYGAVMIHNDHALRAAVALSFGVGLASSVGIVLNWYFGIAPLFCIRNGSGAMEALDEAVAFSGRHAGRLFLLGWGFLALRMLWAGVMGLIFFSPLNLAESVRPGWILCLMGVVVVVYFAGSDLLYLARLGVYAALAEDDARPEPAAPPEVIPPVDVIPLVGLA